MPVTSGAEAEELKRLRADEIIEGRDSMNVRRVIPLFVGVVAVATAAVLVISATTLVTAHAAAAGVQGAGAPPSPGSLTRARIGEFGLDLAAMDRSVAPGDDFYRYVNGGWLRNSQIPGDVPRFTEFGRLADLNATRNHSILEKAAAAPRTPEERKAGDFYASLIDDASREASGPIPLKPELDRIAAIATPADLARAIAQVNRDWLRPLPGGAAALPPSPINSGVSIDIKNPTRYLPALGQGGLGLPDRDYFLVDDPAFAKAREAYKTHVVRMFQLAGMSDAQARATRVYALEDRLAKGHWTRAEQRDPEKAYNLMTLAELTTKAPGLDWTAFLEAAGFASAPQVLVSQPSAIAVASLAASEVPLQDWKDYLAYRSIRAFAPFGPKAFVAEHFDFESRTLAGTPQMPEPWKTASAQTDQAIGQAVGTLYLEQYFPSEARAKAEQMTREIKAAMGRRIERLTWMAPETKARAMRKLAAVQVQIGAQTPPNDYSDLRIVRGRPFENALEAARFAYGRNVAKLGAPVTRHEWTMLAHTVNAQANAVLVKIMFPAGIMQGLFFDPAADPAVNYAAIGVVMGHELSHVFDDQGSKFDERGALNNWWTGADLKRFTLMAEALAAQYDRYEPLPGVHINGHLTLGENIGDLAGLSLALDAYHASLGGRPAPVLGGFTADQRFFMGYAQLYRTLQREGFLRQQLATDPHSPGEWRAAEVRNVDAWYAAFDVKPGARMYLPPDQRVKVW
jgi:putative endopeptidase